MNSIYPIPLKGGFAANFNQESRSFSPHREVLAKECISKCEAFKDKKGTPLKKDQALSLQAWVSSGSGRARNGIAFFDSHFDTKLPSRNAQICPALESKAVNTIDWTLQQGLYSRLRQCQYNNYR